MGHGRLAVWRKNLLFLAVFAMLAAGCAVKQGKEKTKELEYTVLKPAEIPGTLADEIEEKKESAFTLAYSDNEYLYIARGYGEQETGGYSIKVEDCSVGENAIYVKCTLSGPAVGEQVNIAPSYPYIVLKTELREERIVFE